MCVCVYVCTYICRGRVVEGEGGMEWAGEGWSGLGRDRVGWGGRYIRSWDDRIQWAVWNPGGEQLFACAAEDSIGVLPSEGTPPTKPLSEHWRMWEIKPALKLDPLPRQRFSLGACCQETVCVSCLRPEGARSVLNGLLKKTSCFQQSSTWPSCFGTSVPEPPRQLSSFSRGMN